MTDLSHRPGPQPGRWLALVVIATATLMIVLDVSIINIALPVAQAELGISDANRAWVVTAYALTFGGLLLLGGRFADLVGRKRTFIIGLVGFAAASALGGFAGSELTLIAARALQGIFGALLAPAALSLLTTTFTEPGERAKAFAVYGAVQGMGGAVGLLLGGALTEYLSWRWCLFINVPISLVVILAARSSLAESRVDASPGLDVAGGALSVFGLAALVYGFTLAAEDGGLPAPVTIVAIVGGMLLLALFVLRQSKATAPLLPLQVVTDRNRAAAYLSLGLIGAGMFGMLLFLSFYLQSVLAFTPFLTGLAFLPFSLGIIAGSTVASHLVPRLGNRKVMLLGLAGAAFGILWLAQIDIAPNVLGLVLPAITLMSFGLGIYFVPGSSAALIGVRETDAGVASALVNASQQVGGALGPAIFNTLFISLAGAQTASIAAVPAYRAVFLTATAFYILALLAVLFLASERPAQAATATPAPLL